MTSRRGLVALAASGLLPLAACGAGEPERPAHRPLSVIYIAGDPAGPWAQRTEGLADGVKIAIAERDGLIGDRAASTAVVPIEQRDGDQVSAAIGTGRILRDSRTLGVLGTYSADQLEISAPQLNGGELALLQYGTGMRGLLAAERQGEPGRYQPSGRSLAARGVPSDEALAEAVGDIPQIDGTPTVLVATEWWKQQRRLTRDAAAAAKRAREAAVADGKTGDELPPLSPGNARSMFTPVNDATRIGDALRAVTNGSATERTTNGRQVVVINPTEPDPAAVARRIARRSSGLLVLVDGADRAIPAAAVAGHHGPVYRVRRTLADATTPAATALRAKERALFGRDRADAVVAGYRAAKRMLELAAAQPDKTIDRLAYASQLVADAPTQAQLPIRNGQILLGGVVVERLSGSRWVAAGR
ncbi:MAG: hypothetical protein QM679_09970 [Patulibacter sp.]